MTESVRFDRAAGFYDATRGYPPGVEERVAEALVEAGHLGRASRVLEVGIGTGRIALPLARRVAAVYGVDLSRPMLERLLAKRGALRVAAALGDATRLPFADRSFDAAVAVHVFHLVPAWREALAELARVLRPGAPLLNGGDAGGMVRAFLRAEAEASLDRASTEQRWRELVGADLADAQRDVGVSRERSETFPADEGWRPLAGTCSVAYVQRITPRELLAQLERRSWSSTWRLDGAQLAALVARVRAALIERLGSLDGEVEVRREFRVRPWAASG